LFNAGRYVELESQTRFLIEQFPESGFAWKVLGAVLQVQGKSALSAMERSAHLLPDDAEAHSNLGATFQELGRFHEAESCCRRALQIKPHYAEAHNNLGNILQDLGQLDNAVDSYRRAVTIKPDYAEAYSNLGVALKGLGRLEEAVANLQKSLLIKPDYIQARSNLLFTHNYQPEMPSAVLLAEARRFGDMVAQRARPYTNWPNVAEPDRCLRVGLVSGDLFAHPVGYFLDSVLATLSTHFADRLKLIAYPSYFRTDELTDRIKASCHDWHSAVGLSDETLARRIREDGIDILIDLSGHTAHNRLPMFAWKPAPVQVSWLGYFATTGVASIDYVIADPWTITQAEEANFSEKIWRLPETRLCFTPPEVPVDLAPLPALKNGYITFGCFNNLSKVNDSVISLWARVLAAVPDSRLFLKAKQLKEISLRQSIIDRFVALGVDAARLILEDVEPRMEYLTAYHRTDISLDTFPFPGGATSAESLWMGVPVLILPGESFLSRQGLGLLMNVGLPEWVATDANDYVTRAVAHTSNLRHLAALRGGLRQKLLASPLCDAPRFARHLELALREMWQAWCVAHELKSSSA
jgi:predicted O-linked N-acetylglucosamine transferase (SPINDLY family)